ncbi:MAG: oligosaccharide flippase family protein, partial [Bacteroidales bacterium]|nr:oligosaccharide flippase family protein [Bacteroidales bacterium]
SRQMLIVPISFITASLSQVLLKELSDRVKNNAKLTPSILKTAMYLSIGIIPFMVVIMIWGEGLFSFFFSETWRVSGSYSAILAPAFAVQFIVSPLSISFTVLEKLKVLAAWQICYFGAVLALLSLSYLPITHFLAIYTGINIVAYTIYFLLIINCTRKYDKRTGNES